jgi:prepilin-type processing-associated H-X9-DG protein
MYAQDYDELFPYMYYVPSMTWPLGFLLSNPPNSTPVSTSPNTYDGSSCYYQLMPYVKNTQMWFCLQVPKNPGDCWVNPTTNLPPTTYHVNSMVVIGDYWKALGKGVPSYYGGGPVSLGDVGSASTTFLWEDWGQGYNGLAIHNGGTNFLCCDGHAKWIRQGMKTVTGGWTN